MLNRGAAMCQVLCKSPYDSIVFEQEQSLVPYYKIKSITTVLLCMYFITYVTLVYQYPPFLQIPHFSLQWLNLSPGDLKHFSFYRIITASFVCENLYWLFFCCFMVWILGSYTEQVLGWKMATVLTGFWGLAGVAGPFSIPSFLLGCNYACILMRWAVPNIPVNLRKAYLAIFVVVILIYVYLFFYFGFKVYSIHVPTIYGIFLTFIFGMNNDPLQLSTFRKITKFTCTIAFLILTTAMIMSLMFNRNIIV